MDRADAKAPRFTFSLASWRLGGLLLAVALTACRAHATQSPREEPPPPTIYGPAAHVGPPRLHRHGRCDHPSRWHDGQRVWWYMGGWEFVEDGVGERAGKLYRYEPAPRNQDD